MMAFCIISGVLDLSKNGKSGEEGTGSQVSCLSSHVQRQVSCLSSPVPGLCEVTHPLTQVLSHPGFQIGDIGHLHDPENACLFRSEESRLQHLRRPSSVRSASESECLLKFCGLPALLALPNSHPWF